MLRLEKKIGASILVLSLILLSTSISGVGISGQEIINNMQKAYEKQMAGINDYMVIQKASGGVAAMAGETKIYYQKAKVEGEEIYKMRTESQPMGMTYVSIYDGKYNWTTNFMTGKIEKELAESNPSQFWKNINLDKIKYLGEEMIDGERAYILQIENALQVMGSQQAQARYMQGEGPQEALGKLWISSKTWMPLRMQLVLKTDSEGTKMNMITTTNFKDYRQVGTMLHPFQLVMEISTEVEELGTAGMSEEEKKEKEEAMELMQSMMSGMGSFTIETVDLKVNIGLSDDLFDGTKLK